MPKLKIVSRAGKQSSAKKRKGSKPAQDSGEPQETPQAPAGRNTRTSRKANETAPQRSPSPHPIKEYTIRMEGRSQLADSSTLPGSTGRSNSRSKTCTTYPPAFDVIVGAPTLEKLAEKVEDYLLDSTKEKMYYDSVVVTVQVEKSINFHKPAKVRTGRDFELLYEALQQRPNTTINVQIDWLVHPTLDAAAVDMVSSAASPSSSSASMRSNNTTTTTSSKRRRGSSYIITGSERVPGQQVLDDINFYAGQLHGFYVLCNKCKKTKNKDAICYTEPGGRHFCLSHHQITTWADHIRLGKASYAAPPEGLLSGILDTPATPRGINAASSLAGGTAQGSDSQETPALGEPSGSQINTTNNHVPIVIRESPEPAGRTPFGNITNAPAAATAGLPMVSGPDWPLIEFATRKSERHRSLAELLVTHRIDEMSILARAHHMKVTASLKLTPIEEVIITGWVEDWQKMTMSYDEWKAQATSATGGAAFA